MGTAGELVDVLPAYGQRMPRELLGLGPPPPLVDPPSSGGDDNIDGKGGDVKGGRAGAATSRMRAIAEGGSVGVEHVPGGGGRRRRLRHPLLTSRLGQYVPTSSPVTTMATFSQSPQTFCISRLDH